MHRRHEDSSKTSPTIDTPLAPSDPRRLAPEPVAAREATGPVLRRLEQFVLLEHLGAGGMGTVYAAFDEKLERKVAIKLVATHAGNARAEQRLLREAQAQARLSHPNVVTIYEVGALPEGGLFIAIELVKGETLRDWQRAEPRPRAWHDVVARYVAAGQGLAAAHRVGIIHRDFKPDNILVGEDGRVRVADFGLAFAAHPDRAEDGEAATAREPRRPAATPSSLPALTEAGSLTGTPGYLAPELFTGATADARSDQFSFCVALYEALHGERPYGDFALLHEAPLPRRGEPDPSYPRWLWDVMMRGLALAPGDRFASMDALLVELTRSRARTRRVVTAAALMAVLAIAAAAVAWTRPDEPAVCPSNPAALAGVWDPATRQQVRAALLGTGAPFAARVWASTVEAFDRYAEHWTSAQKDACEATHVQHVQSDAMLDLRMECLAGRRRALAAAAEALQSRPGQAVGHAGEIRSSLGDIELCADTRVLRELDASRGPARARPLLTYLQAELAEVRRRLARARPLLAMGDVAGAEPLIAEARQLAGNLDDEQVGAEIAYLEARIQLSHGDIAGSHARFDRAIERAMVSHHDELVADIWLDRAVTAGSREQRPAEIAWWIAQGELWIRRLGHPGDSRRVQLEGARGYLQLTEGDARAAVASLSRALEIAEPLWGKTDPRLIPLLRDRATAQGRLGRAAPAVADAERALALGVAAWGPDYPDIAATRCVLGLLYIEQRNDLDRGERELTRALALYRAQLGAESIDVAICEQGLSEARQRRGDYAAALLHAERAEQILARQLGANSTRHGEALNGVGALRFLRKDFTGSLAAYEAAYPILRDALGPSHTTVALLLSNTGETLLALARHELAQADFTRALDILERKVGAEHAYVAFPLKGLGLVQLARGRPAEALAQLERALDVHTRSAVAGDPQELAEIRWGLARALTALGRDRARARTLAEAALAGYRGLGGESAARVREIVRWLATTAHMQ
ncbi:MAG: tetratricopeptide repeat protein [Deltaproteobacteria bacterium]|nr:MAG: tetratricopeptide repeat protein [Deltaproteobacteria bacterium]